MLGPGSDTIRRCGVGLSLGVAFKTLILAAWMQQPSNEDTKLLTPPVPCLPGCCHVPTLMIMDGTSEPISQLQLNVLIKVALVMVSVHSSKTITKTQDEHQDHCFLLPDCGYNGTNCFMILSPCPLSFTLDGNIKQHAQRYLFLCCLNQVLCQSRNNYLYKCLGISR